MSRNLTYFNNNRIVYKRDPVTDKPTYETDKYMFFEHGTYECYHLFTSKAIASNATTELLTNPLILQESEVLKVQAADANRLQVIASVLEVQPRTVLGGAAS